MMGGKPAFTYNFVGLSYLRWGHRKNLHPASTPSRFDLAYEGGRGGGGMGTISVDGKKTGEGRIAKTNYNTFGIDESADVGKI